MENGKCIKIKCVNSDNVLKIIDSIDNEYYYDIDIQWIAVDKKPVVCIKIMLYLTTKIIVPAVDGRPPAPNAGIKTTHYKLNGEGCYSLYNVNCDISNFIDECTRKTLVKCMDRFIDKDYQHAIDKMNEIKTKFKIDTSEKLDYYIKKWGNLSGSNITNKVHLFSAGIKSIQDFIDWIEINCSGDLNGV